MAEKAEKDSMRISAIGIKPQQGFTLIEVIIVLVLVALAAALTVPNLEKMNQNQELKRCMEQIYDNLVLLRNEAISYDRTMKMDFYPQARCYRFTIGEEVIEQSFKPFFLEEPALDKDEKDENEEKGMLSVSFYGDGTSSGLNLVFIDEYTNEKYVCKVAPENSQITWER